MHRMKKLVSTCLTYLVGIVAMCYQTGNFYAYNKTTTSNVTSKFYLRTLQ